MSEMLTNVRLLETDITQRDRLATIVLSFNDKWNYSLTLSNDMDRDTVANNLIEFSELIRRHVHER